MTSKVQAIKYRGRNKLDKSRFKDNGVNNENLYRDL